MNKSDEYANSLIKYTPRCFGLRNFRLLQPQYVSVQQNKLQERILMTQVANLLGKTAVKPPLTLLKPYPRIEL
jgi:hypothetical protein